MCKSQKTVHEVEEDKDALCLGCMTANKKPWIVGISINGRKVACKINTGADFVAMPYVMYKDLYRNGNPPALERTTKPLFGPEKSQLDIVGFTEVLLKKDDKEAMEDVYITRTLHTALLE